MRVWVECKSPLLQKSLELFLEKYLSTAKRCDIIVRDEECLNDERCFYVGVDESADLKKPFSKSQLILALESKYIQLYGDTKTVVEDEVQSMDFNVLQKRIEYLTQEYQENILRAVKAFYEK